MRTYEIRPSANRFQVCEMEDGAIVRRIWPKHDSEQEALDDMSARQRREAVLVAPQGNGNQ